MHNKPAFLQYICQILIDFNYHFMFARQFLPKPLLKITLNALLDYLLKYQYVKLSVQLVNASK